MKRKFTPALIKEPLASIRRWVLIIALVVVSAAPLLTLTPASAADLTPIQQPKVVTKSKCGSGENAVETSIDIGCYGDKCKTTNAEGCSALLDAVFAIIRLLVAGVGIVIIGSVIFAGIQYISARDDPNAVGKAKSRITSSLIALLIFIFGYAILNYVIPAGFLGYKMYIFSLYVFNFFAAGTGPPIGGGCTPTGGGFLGFPAWYKYLNGIGTTSGDPTLPNVCTPRFERLADVWLIAAAVIEIMLRLAALAAVVFIVYGAIQLITAQGDPNGSKQARQTIVNAVIGLIIAIAATTIISFIAGRFS